MNAIPQPSPETPESQSDPDEDFIYTLSGYEIQDLRDREEVDDQDWMTRLLMNRVFQQVPPANLQAIFARLDPLPTRSGDVIVTQDEEGDYFYVITSGQCAVTRNLPTGKDSINLAVLGVGDTFGEEALISNSRRQATVTMMSDGSLMRLNKDDFNKLLAEPIISYATADHAEAIVSKGGKWLDVAATPGNNIVTLAEILHIPLQIMRLKLATLEFDITYIVTSEDITHSRAAAHILSQFGVNVFVLDTA